MLLIKIIRIKNSVKRFSLIQGNQRNKSSKVKVLKNNCPALGQSFTSKELLIYL